MVVGRRILRHKTVFFSPFVRRRPLFSMGECSRPLSAHMTPGGRIGPRCSSGKHTIVLQKWVVGWGFLLQWLMEAGLPFPHVQPNNSRIWLQGRQANTLQIALLFARRSSPPPSILHLLGSGGVFPWSPLATVGPVDGGQLSHDVTTPK